MIPAEIKIGTQIYSVRLDKNEYLEGAELLGQVEYASNEIRVKSTMPQARQHNTFIHELVHAMLYECGYTEFNDERLIRPLANILYQVIKENDLSFVKEA